MSCKYGAGGDSGQNPALKISVKNYMSAKIRAVVKPSVLVWQSG